MSHVFKHFQLKEMQWHHQGNHAIDKFMASVAATIGDLPGSSTGLTTDSEAQHPFLQRSDTELRLGSRPLRLQSRAPRCHRDALSLEGALECGAMQRFRVAL